MNLDYAWLIGMRDYLTRENTDHPPKVFVPDPDNPLGPPIEVARPFGIIQTGRWLEDPQENFGVLTLHLGDMDDAGWWHERITSARMEQNENMKGSQAPFGRFMEIGGATQWLFRYSAEMRLYYTLEGYDQVLALAHATESVHWLVKRMHSLSPRKIGVGTVEGWTPRYQVCDAFKPEERGGTDNWIWYCKLHLELYVHAAVMA